MATKNYTLFKPLIMELDLFDLEKRICRLMNEERELIILQTLMTIGSVPTQISQSKAYRLFNRTRIAMWVRAGLITPKKEGKNTSTVYYDHIRLKELSNQENRHLYRSAKQLAEEAETTDKLIKTDGFSTTKINSAAKEPGTFKPKTRKARRK